MYLHAHTRKILKPQTNFKIFEFFFGIKLKKPDPISLNKFFFLTIGAGSEPQMPLVMQQCGQAFHPDLAQLCFLKKCNLSATI